MRDDIHCYQTCLDGPPCGAITALHQLPDLNSFILASQAHHFSGLNTQHIACNLRSINSAESCKVHVQPITRGVEVFAVVVAPPAGAVIPIDQRDGQEHEEEAKADHDAIAAALVQQHSCQISPKVGRLQTGRM